MPNFWKVSPPRPTPLWQVAQPLSMKVDRPLRCWAVRALDVIDEQFLGFDPSHWGGELPAEEFDHEGANQAVFVGVVKVRKNQREKFLQVCELLFR